MSFLNLVFALVIALLIASFLIRNVPSLVRIALTVVVIVFIINFAVGMFGV